MISRSVAIHDGTFHADEVTACALLILFDQIDQEKIFRTRDPKKLEESEFVCDVGAIYDSTKKRFDHHQSDYEGSLSSAGMVLLYLKENQIIDEPTYRFLNRSLILGIDAIDNGQVNLEVGHCSFSYAVSNFMPIRYGSKPEELKSAFDEALDFVLGHLARQLLRHEYIEECKEIVKKEMEKGQKVLYFEESMPWMEAFFDLGGEDHPALFLIMPTGEHWKLRGIPPSEEDRMSVRKPLPEEWAGLLEGELKEKTGISGAIFCHKGRFISIWETKEDAVQALERIL